MKKELELKLENLTNEDLYFIVSDMLGLGGLGSQLIEREKLFVSFNSVPGEINEIHFFFLSKLPCISDTMDQPETKVTLGKFDLLFEEIEYSTFYSSASLIDPDNEPFDSAILAEHFKSPQATRINLNRMTKGLEYLRSKSLSSSYNDLFKIYHESPIDKKFVRSFDFDINPDINFSGTYYLIVEPPEELNQGGSIINHFEVIDNFEMDDDYVQSSVLCTPVLIEKSLIEL